VAIFSNYLPNKRRKIQLWYMMPCSGKIWRWNFMFLKVPRLQCVWGWFVTQKFMLSSSFSRVKIKTDKDMSLVKFDCQTLVWLGCSTTPPLISLTSMSDFSHTTKCDPNHYLQCRSLVTHKSNLSPISMFKKTATDCLIGRFVEQRLMLSSTFRCQLIHNCQRRFWSHFFGHT
jgi:hypothetical protein